MRIGGSEPVEEWLGRLAARATDLDERQDQGSLADQLSEGILSAVGGLQRERGSLAENHGTARLASAMLGVTTCFAVSTVMMVVGFSQLPSSELSLNHA